MRPRTITFKKLGNNFAQLREQVTTARWLAEKYQCFWGRGREPETWNFMSPKEPKA